MNYLHRAGEAADDTDVGHRRRLESHHIPLLAQLVVRVWVRRPGDSTDDPNSWFNDHNYSSWPYN